MDGIKDEIVSDEEEDDGRGAWNTVHLGICFLLLYYIRLISFYRKNF